MLNFCPIITSYVLGQPEIWFGRRWKKRCFGGYSCMHSGPLGGDAEIAAMVVRKEIDLAVFLIDDLNPQPHEADIQMLLRQCRVHNVPIACNRYSADLMITSTLWDDESYVPTEPKYVYFKRE